MVDLSNIDRVPVTIFMPTDDSVCPSDKAVEHFELIQSEKYLVWEYGDHGVFYWYSDDEFMDRLEEIIITGNTTSVLTGALNRIKMSAVVSLAIAIVLSQ